LKNYIDSTAGTGGCTWYHSSCDGNWHLVRTGYRPYLVVLIYLYLCRAFTHSLTHSKYVHGLPCGHPV